MNHMMRKVFSIAALVFALIGTGPVMAQGVMKDDDFLRLCAEGTAEKVRQALESGANINAKKKDKGMTVLMIYAGRNNADPAVMEELLKAADKFNREGLWKKGKNILGLKTVDVNDGNEEGVTALMFAVERECNPEVVEKLLKAGADANAKDKQKMTVLMRAARSSSPEVVRMLLDAEADVSAEDNNGRTALEFVKERKSAAPEVEEMLQDAKVVRMDEAFLNLCAKGTAEKVSQALNAGANIDAKDDQHTTTLMYAVRGNADQAVIKVLLEAAAEFNKKGLWQKGKSKLGFKTVDVNDKNSNGMTALMFAVENERNSSDVVQVLLDVGADVNDRDKQKKTVLMFAAENNSPDVVQVLLDAGADVNAKDEQDMTALMHAVTGKGDADVVEKLLNARADVCIKDKKGKTALMYAEEKKSSSEVVKKLQHAQTVAQKARRDIDFCNICATGTAEEVSQAIKSGANVAAQDPQGKTALMYAAEKNSPKVVQVLLKPQAKIVNAKDKDDMTALMYAAKSNTDPAVMEELLKAVDEFNGQGIWPFKNKVGINDKSKKGMTALMFAVENNSPEVVQVLLKGGADVNAKDKDDKTVLMRVLEGKTTSSEIVTLLLREGANVNIKNGQGMTVLMWAVAKNFSPEVVELLLARMDVNAKDKNDMTALMWAATSKSSPEVVEKLLKAGADINAKDKNDVTALMWAARNSSPEVVKLLLGANVNAKDKEGMTALMYAARENTNAEVVKVLSDKADINAEDEKGLTALMHAAWKNSNPEVVDALLVSGANVYVKDKKGNEALDYAKKGKNKRAKDIIHKHIDPIDYYIDKIMSYITIKNIKRIFKGAVLIIVLCFLIKISKIAIKIIRI